MYEQRIQRSVDKSTAQLKELQAERKEEAREAMKQAARLYRLARAEGKPYRPEAYFTGAPEVLESVFSTTEVAREVSRAKLFWDADNYHNLHELPKKDVPEQPMEASAG